jgi:hypothetical protein
VPTYEALPRFWSQYRPLRPDEKRAFLRARKEFIQVLQAWEIAGRPGTPSFPKGLGVKPMVGNRNILEFAWAPDGRCTWSYGTPKLRGRFHVIWRRIGSHAIYSDP